MKLMTTSRTKGAMVLAGAVLSALVLLSMINSLTGQRISDARQQWLLDSLASVLPPGPFDQNPVESLRQHTVLMLGGKEPLDVYTAFRNGKPAAAVLEVLTPDGYSGNIRLLIGIRADGNIVAARVIDHDETPGLGDGIDARRSDWINQFNDQSLESGSTTQWRLGKSDAQFDALTGATISSRAVLRIIQRTLLWFENNQQELFKR